MLERAVEIRGARTLNATRDIIYASTLITHTMSYHILRVPIGRWVVIQEQMEDLIGAFDDRNDKRSVAILQRHEQ